MTSQELFAELKKNDIASVTVEYSGSGDSGSVEPALCFDADSKPIDVSDELDNAIGNFVYDELAKQHGGWEINEGSRGTVEFNVNEGKVKFEHIDYVVEENASEHEIMVELPPEPDNPEKKELCNKLKKRGIVKVVVEYNGEGDEGNINSTACYDADGNEVSISQALTNEIDAYIENKLPSGWEINEGSSGTATIDVVKQRTKFDHYENEMKQVPAPFDD